MALGVGLQQSRVTPIEDTRGKGNTFSINLSNESGQNHFDRAAGRSGMSAGVGSMASGSASAGGATRLIFDPETGSMSIDFDMGALEGLFSETGENPQNKEQPQRQQQSQEQSQSSDQGQEKPPGQNFTADLQELVMQLLSKAILAGFTGGAAGG